jgi:hypothetical protein
VKPFDIDDFLSHYGIKGMRWGVRRANPSGESAPKSEDHERSRATKQTIKTSGTKSLSNKDLKDYLERMDLEKRYHKDNPSTAKKVGKVVGDFLLNMGKKEAASFASKQVGNFITAKYGRN